MRRVGTICVFETDDGVHVLQASYHTKKYDELEGRGETLADALEDLLCNVEDVPE
jgi:hypothetical protein